MGTALQYKVNQLPQEAFAFVYKVLKHWFLEDDKGRFPLVESGAKIKLLPISKMQLMEGDTLGVVGHANIVQWVNNKQRFHSLWME